jgi:hypothetical protein
MNADQPVTSKESNKCGPQMAIRTEQPHANRVPALRASTPTPAGFRHILKPC